MEFQTSVKGTNCEYICSEVATGQSTAEEAAKAYDDDCKKQATCLEKSKCMSAACVSGGRL